MLGIFGRIAAAQLTHAWSQRSERLLLPRRCLCDSCITGTISTHQLVRTNYSDEHNKSGVGRGGGRSEHPCISRTLIPKLISISISKALIQTPYLRREAAQHKLLTLYMMYLRPRVPLIRQATPLRTPTATIRNSGIVSQSPSLSSINWIRSSHRLFHNHHFIKWSPDIKALAIDPSEPGY